MEKNAAKLRSFLTILEFYFTYLLFSSNSWNVQCVSVDRQSPQLLRSDLDKTVPSAWIQQTPHRSLLSAAKWEQTTLFPPIWKAMVDGGRNPDRYNVSIDCSESLRDYSDGLARREPWAVRMYDSSGKPVPGTMMGGLTQYGNYDECLNLRHYGELEPNETVHAGRRTTQYCSVFFDTPAWIVDFVNSLDVPYPPKVPRVTVDLCVPRSCTPPDLHHLVSQYVTSSNFTVVVEDKVECFQEPEFAEDAAAIVLVIFLSTILLLVFIGTCLDFIQRLNNVEAVSGEVTKVGLLRRRTSRLSRLGSSFYFHWKRLGSVTSTDSGQDPDDYPSEHRRNTIGHKPSFIRRLSRSFIGRKDDENPTGTFNRGHDPPNHTPEIKRSTSREGKGLARSTSAKGGGKNSHGIPSHDLPCAQLKLMKKLDDSGDLNGDEMGTTHHALTNERQQKSNGVIIPEIKDKTITAQNGDHDFTDIGEAEVRNTITATQSTGISTTHANAASPHQSTPEAADKYRQNQIDSGQTTDSSDASHCNTGGSSPNTHDHCRCSCTNCSCSECKRDPRDQSNTAADGDHNISAPSTCEKETTACDQFEEPENTKDGKKNTKILENIHEDIMTHCKNVEKDETAKQSDNKKSSGVNRKTLNEDSDTNSKDKQTGALSTDSGQPTTNIQKTDEAEASDTLNAVSANAENSCGKQVDPKDNAPNKTTSDPDPMSTTSFSGSATPTSSKKTGAEDGADSLNSSETQSAEVSAASQKPSSSSVGINNKAPESPSEQTPNPINEQPSGEPSQILSENSPEANPAANSSLSPTKRAEDLITKQNTAVKRPPDRPQLSEEACPLIDTSLEVFNSSPKEESNLQTDSAPETFNSSPTRSNRSSKLLRFHDKVVTPSAPPDAECTTTPQSPPASILWSRTNSLQNKDFQTNIPLEADDLSLPGTPYLKPRLTSLHSVPEETPEEVRRQSCSVQEETVNNNNYTKKEDDIIRWRWHGKRRRKEDGMEEETSFGKVHVDANVEGNNVDTVKMAQTMWFQAPMNGTFAADTFFILSGCLVCYHFLRGKSKQLEENPKARVLSITAVLLFYLHRIMRIIPCYYVALLSYTTLLPYLGNGPRWSSTVQELGPCRDHWWANALFFSNFYKPQEMCMSWSYYLVNDIQMYFLSPLVLYPLLYIPPLGLTLLVLLVATQIVTTAVLVTDNNGNLLSLGKEFFANVYAKPYCRVGAFAVGMGLGYFLHSTQRKIYFRKTPLLLGWLASLAVVGVVVYVTQSGMEKGGEEGWSGLQWALYQAFSRPVWSLAVAFIIFVCTVGQGGFVYRLLSWNAFLPLCRITYGVYLLHPILITLVLNSIRSPFYMTFGSLVYMFVANLTCAYGLAFFLITLVESPFTSLEAVLLSRFR